MQKVLSILNQKRHFKLLYIKLIVLLVINRKINMINLFLVKSNLCFFFVFLVDLFNFVDVVLPLPLIEFYLFACLVTPVHEVCSNNFFGSSYLILLFKF